MRKLLAMFLIFIFLVLAFLASKKIEFSQTGKFFKVSEDDKPKWRVVGRVEILNGEIVSLNIK